MMQAGPLIILFPDLWTHEMVPDEWIVNSSEQLLKTTVEIT